MRETHRNKLKIYSQSQEREYILYTLKRTNKAQVVDIRTVQLARSQRQRREENISIRTKTKRPHRINGSSYGLVVILGSHPGV